MKVAIEVILDGNVSLSASADIKTLADVAKLGKKLAALPAGVKKAVPDLFGRKVERIKVAREEQAAASRASA